MPVSVLPTAATAEQECEISVTPRREEDSSGAPEPNSTENRQERMKNKDTFVDDDAAEPERVEDVEMGSSATPVPNTAWRQSVNADADTYPDGAVNQANQDTNETMRAQHEYGSRR